MTREYGISLGSFADIIISFMTAVKEPKSYTVRREMVIIQREGKRKISTQGVYILYDTQVY